MGGPNLEIFKVSFLLIRPYIPDHSSRELLTISPLSVWDVYHVSHRMDVLFWYKSRVALLSTRFLA